jgi:hypothetical protein
MYLFGSTMLGVPGSTGSLKLGLGGYEGAQGNWANSNLIFSIVGGT